MRNVRFYEEFTNKRKGESAGTVVALHVDDSGRPLYNTNSSTVAEALSGVFKHPNSAVATTGVSQEYLRTSCKRVSEARARAVHPRLFDRLDRED